MAGRTLAVSVVVTMSLAEIGCTPSGNGQPREQISPNPPDPGTMKIEPRGEPEVEPETTDERRPEKVEVTTNVRVERRGDGCVEIVDVACPEGVACNPPPPKQVPCPEEHLPEAAPDEKMFRQDDGTCWAHKDFSCPEGATCNPPPPRQVRCPPEEKLPKATNPERVTKRPNGECWESFSVRCPPGTRCNPPPPRRVECPPDVE